MDIDGDGQVEWPISSRMNGYEGESVQWVTRWMNWDYTTRTVQMKYSDLVNLEDRYSLRADEDFWQGVTAAYDKDGRLLTISTVMRTARRGSGAGAADRPPWRKSQRVICRYPPRGMSFITFGSATRRAMN